MLMIVYCVTCTGVECSCAQNFTFSHPNEKFNQEGTDSYYQYATYADDTSIHNSQNCSVTVLNLVHFGLHGTIPDEIRDLPQLQVLRLTNNSIYGTLPSALFELSRLRYLELKYNEITGSCACCVVCFVVLNSTFVLFFV